MEKGDNFGAGGRQSTTYGGDEHVETALLPDGQASTEKSPGSLTEPLAVAHGAHQLGLRVAGRDTFELAQGGRPQDSVDREVEVALEVSQGARGESAEYPVDTTGVETESRQTLLQVSDVVAPEHGSVEVEEPVSQADAGLDQGPPRLTATDPVDAQTPSVLECLHRSGGARSEQPFGVGRARQSDLVETMLQIDHGRSEVARPQGKDGTPGYRYG
jgi:hypothetical protein